MKKLILAFFLLTIACSLFAQNIAETLDPVAQQATDKLTKQLHLNNSQVKEVLRIQERRQNQLQRIASLKNTNIDAYYSRLEDVLVSNKAAVQMILNKEQLKNFHALSTASRIERADVVNALRKDGHSNIEIERALLDMEID